MITLVYGGSGSGKSKFAEQLVISSKAERKYYVATMQVYDDEGRRKVERHRKLRDGKGFVTMEAPVDIGAVARQIADGVQSGETYQIADGAQFGETLVSKTAVLLECMMNLVANEMFPPESEDGQLGSNGGIEESVVVSRIISGLEELFSCADDIIIVSGNVFEDGSEYEESTLTYMRALSVVNAFIASKADEVYEVVAGIPLKIARQDKCAHLFDGGKSGSAKIAGT
jgi:adenosylcobinamide kinase/adenosylcobinamide-phosphate guanylyltransferase